MIIITIQQWKIRCSSVGRKQECFFECLKTLCQQAGFVFRKLCLDNLSAAVVKAKEWGQEMIFADEFEPFVIHYGDFEPQNCNSRKG